MCRMDKQTGPVIEHRELYSISCGKTYGQKRPGVHGHSPTVNSYSTHSLEFQRRSRETKRSAIVIVQAREMWAQWGC